MQIFNKIRGTKGFITLWEQMLRFRYMISEIAKQRIKILVFWDKYGDMATREAFSVSRRTLFRWQESLRKEQGKLEALNPGKTAPKARRKRVIQEEILSKIISLRKLHPRIGKDKLRVLLLKDGYTLSSSTIGRVISDLKRTNRIPIRIKYSFYGRTGKLIEQKREYRKKLRRPKGLRVLEVDTVVRFVYGLKRYILTATDTERHTSFAVAYTNHGSRSAADFLKKCIQVLPDCPTHIQTDNGSEFALHFETACRDTELIHFHTYPRSPKMNAHIERFNRTLDEEFLYMNKALLYDDVHGFNLKLMDWLVWYNSERPHYSLGQVSPLCYMMKEIPVEKCQMWWTHTQSCFAGLFCFIILPIWTPISSRKSTTCTTLRK